MNTILKIISIILISFIIFAIIPYNNTYATSIDGIITGADDFVSDGADSHPININDLKPMSDTIYNVLLVLAVVVAVIIGLAIGIKFMTGSVSEKAQVKETLIPYIAGCVVIFGSFAIWKLVVEILSSI